jgi:uncharacterized protein YndB with AHSA1/START domain
MMYPESLGVSTSTNGEIRVTRVFDAPHALVFDAFTEPELVDFWLFGLAPRYSASSRRSS